MYYEQQHAPVDDLVPFRALEQQQLSGPLRDDIAQFRDDIRTQLYAETPVEALQCKLAMERGCDLQGRSARMFGRDPRELAALRVLVKNAPVYAWHEHTARSVLAASR